MNIKRAFLILAAALLLPGLAMAGTTAGTASFTVDVTFIPDTGKKTTANISCSGVVAPNDQSSGLLGNGEDTAFLVDSISLGFADCDVSVNDVAGYRDPVYTVGGPNGTDDDFGCHYDGIVDGEVGGAYTCSAVLTATDVRFTVTKEWDITLTGGEFVDPSYSITLTCNQNITGDGGTAGPADCDPSTPSLFCVWDEVGIDKLTFFVDADASQSSAPSCSASESIADSSVETDNDCGARSIAVGSSSSCTISNTVFFEGIPTLNQYGLAIMALLMLGVGFVGFRRFV